MADPAGDLPLISVRGLHKSYPDRADTGARLRILQAVDLELRAGESAAVVGASGIGKSTLLHLLGALDRPDSGEVRYQGANVFAYDNDRLARFRNETVGFVFQFHHLLPEFTALENTMMPGLIRGHTVPAAREAAEALLSRVGMGHRLDHRVTELSGGEQQRVALARALVLKPAVLLADEPTGNLDRQNSNQVHELIWELNRELGMTLVVVTHNTDLAAYMGRRLTLENGRVVEVNSP